MQREIKFRAFDGSEIIEWNTCKDFDTPEQLFKPDMDDWIVMQYTGLKDKNGKEIYEGDITSRGVITFSRGKFQGTYYDSQGNLEEDWEDDLYKEKNIEIIGNIYENANLLSTQPSQE